MRLHLSPGLIITFKHLWGECWLDPLWPVHSDQAEVTALQESPSESVTLHAAHPSQADSLGDRVIIAVR